MVKKVGDVRRLLKKRMELWRKGQIDELVHEFVRCVNCTLARRSRQGTSNDEHAIKVFYQIDFERTTPICS